jgi:hypothetical protein
VRSTTSPRSLSPSARQALPPPFSPCQHSQICPPPPLYLFI